MWLLAKMERELPLHENKQWMRARVLDYASGLKKDVELESVFEDAKKAVKSARLTKNDIFKVIGRIEEDPLSLMYISREEKNRKLRQLKDLLTDIEEQ